MKVRILDTNQSHRDFHPRTGLYATRNYFPFVARIFLSLLFLWSGVMKVLHPGATREYMAAYGMPVTSLFLVTAIAVEILGGMSVLLGIKARWGAAALAIFLIPATLILHTDLSDQIQQIMFWKNIAIFGGLLMVIQYGPGGIVVRSPR